MPLSWFIPQLCFLVAGIIIGGRMWSSARRSGGAPEQTFAAFALCLAMGVCTVMTAVAVRDVASLGTVVVLSTLGAVAMIAAIIMLYVGAWRFYRADSRWAKAAAWAGSLLTLCVGLLLLSRGVLLDPGAGSSAMTVALVSMLVGLAWWGTESLLYYDKLRRRVALDLADPIVADRFRMHGLCSVMLAVIVAITMLCPLVFGHPGRDNIVLGPLMLVLWAAVCVTGTCAWLSPPVYRAYIERRHARAQRS